MNRNKFSLYLTIASTIGLGITAYESAKATPKAIESIQEDSCKNHDGDPNAYTKWEAVKSAWKHYIPALGYGLATTGCIWGSYILDKKQQASMASAYMLMDKFKEKVKERYGQEVCDEIEESIRVEECQDVHLWSNGAFSNCSLDFSDISDPEKPRVFYDSFSQRYFRTTIDKVLEAEYHLNRNFMLEGMALLDDFYTFLGLYNPIEPDLGWCFEDELMWIDFNHTVEHLENGSEILVIDMVYSPSLDWTGNM